MEVSDSSTASSRGSAMKVGFLGAGRMAQALARGFISAGLTESSKIRASCAPDDTVSFNEFQSIGAHVGHDNKKVVSESDVVIVAVKPHIVKTVLKEVKEVFSRDKLLLSVAMGIPIRAMEQELSPGSRVIRAMPNTPALVGTGASAVAGGSATSPEDLDKAQKLFGAVGLCLRLPEYHFDAVTALSGSGPAYVYLVIEGMAAGGVRMGLPWDVSYKLAAQTVLGAATMVTKGDIHPAQLRDNVTSPAGSTAEGLFELEKGKIKATLISAIEQATNVCRKNSQASSS